MFLRFLFIPLCFYFFSLSLWADAQQAKDLHKLSLSLRLKVHSLTPESCATELKTLYHELYDFKPSSFENLESLKTSSRSKNPLYVFFRTRLALHDKFRDWSWNKKFGSDSVQGYKQARDCAKMVKVMNRTLRGFEEYWGLYSLESSSSAVVEETFQGPSPYRVLRPKYRQGYSFPSKGDEFAPGSLKTGDMLLTRGTAFSSAAISRIGDIDNQFSHLALVWIDKEGIYEHFNKVTGVTHPAKKNQVFLLESLLEGGVQVSIMKEWAEHQFGRMVHFRYVGDGSQSDEQLQVIRDKAAELLFVNAKIPHGQLGHINYNYSMEMDSIGATMEDTTLFCSQAISYAYKKSCEALAGSGSICPTPFYTPVDRIFPFPMVYSELPVQSNALAQMLGLTGREVFAPADVEIDPQVEVVAEWRNYGLIEDRRIHDMSLTKLFQWIERGDYNFKEDMPFYEQVVTVGELIYKTMEKMPPETPRGFIKGSGLMAFMIESQGLDEAGVDLLIEKIKNGDAAAVAQLLRNSQLFQSMTEGLSEERLDEVVSRAYPALLEMVGNGQLKRYLTYQGFSKVLKAKAQSVREETGFPPTDAALGRAMEDLRVQYCADYKSGVAVRFHDFFAESFESREKACSTDPSDYQAGGRFDWRQIW